MKRIFYVILIIALFSSLSFAQGEKKLSLNDCIKIALENNSKLRNASHDIDISGTNVTTAVSSILPTVSASLSSGRYIIGETRRKQTTPVDIDSLTGEIVYAQREILQEKIERNSHYASIRLNQTIWDWGKSWCQINQAKLGKKNSEYLYQNYKNFVVYDVQKKYYELLQAKQLGDVYYEAVKRSQEQLNKTESMFKIGSVALADVYKAKVALGNDQIASITQKNLIIDAYANLNVAMGQDPNTSIEVEEYAVNLDQIPYTMENAIESAIQKNPELQSYELNVKNYKIEKRLAKLAYLPTIYGSLSYYRDNEYFDRVYNKKLDQNYTATIGLSMDLNIFNGFADKAEVSRQSLNYAKAEEDLYEQKRLLKANVIQALNVLKATKEIAEINEENLKSANEDLRLAQERYKIGAGTLLEVIESQYAVTNAQSILVRAKYDYQIAQVNLKLLMGTIEK